MRTRILLAVAALCGMLMLGVPAHADVIYSTSTTTTTNDQMITGTVTSVGPEFVTVYTSNGDVSVPLNGTLFVYNNTSIAPASLYVGMPIQAEFVATTAPPAFLSTPIHHIYRHWNGSWDEVWDDAWGHHVMHHGY